MRLLVFNVVRFFRLTVIYILWHFFTFKNFHTRSIRFTCERHHLRRSSSTMHLLFFSSSPRPFYDCSSTSCRRTLKNIGLLLLMKGCCYTDFAYCISFIIWIVPLVLFFFSPSLIVVLFHLLHTILAPFFTKSLHICLPPIQASLHIRIQPTPLPYEPTSSKLPLSLFDAVHCFCLARLQSLQPASSHPCLIPCTLAPHHALPPSLRQQLPARLPLFGSLSIDSWDALWKIIFFIWICCSLIV